jgi:hypothetical protein
MQRELDASLAAVEAARREAAVAARRADELQVSLHSRQICSERTTGAGFWKTDVCSACRGLQVAPRDVCCSVAVLGMRSFAVSAP